MWFRKAADQGTAQSQYNLGLMLADGQGVARNSVDAYKYFTLAAHQSAASAAGFANQATQAREMLAKRMTPSQIAEAQNLASEWRPSSK
jgi:TPR repeat protein